MVRRMEVALAGLVNKPVDESSPSRAGAADDHASKRGGARRTLMPGVVRESTPLIDGYDSGTLRGLRGVF